MEGRPLGSPNIRGTGRLAKQEDRTHETTLASLRVHAETASARRVEQPAKKGRRTAAEGPCPRKRTREANWHCQTVPAGPPCAAERMGAGQRSGLEEPAVDCLLGRRIEDPARSVSPPQPLSPALSAALPWSLRALPATTNIPKERQQKWSSTRNA